MQAERIFTFPDGTSVETMDVPSTTVEHILNSEAGKPPVPIVEVTLAGKYKRREANPKDPDYLLALQAWEAAKQKRVMLFVVAKGVKDEPPEDFVAEYAMYLPEGAPMEEFKYLWLSPKLEGEGVIEAFIEHLLSQTAVTEAGVQEAADRFQGSGEWEPDHGLPLPEQVTRVDNLLTGVRGTAGENLRGPNGGAV